MGLLSRLRDFKHRGDNYDDIRSHVLGEGYPPLMMQEPAPIEPRRALPPVYSEGYPEQGRIPMEIPSGMDVPEIGRAGVDREPFSAPKENVNYDILDRLRMIEAQLSAIRSQTETINERLKNMEARLPRRY
ncbi:MAG: hypothetical protein HZB67_01420 [Candidatus Aenigmarchaeota archaeon]|nr:hypothetical protein [Candidatus Aenigmarchaeota archaeon]